MRKWKKRRGFSALVALTMCLDLLPAALAAEPRVSGLCEHHTEHDAAVCGYVEAVPGVSCQCGETDREGGVVHAGDCGYAEAVEGVPCGYVCGICEAAARDEADMTAPQGTGAGMIDGGPADGDTDRPAIPLRPKPARLRAGMWENPRMFRGRSLPGRRKIPRRRLRREKI